MISLRFVAWPFAVGLVVAVACLILAGDAVAEDPYAWPLDLPRALTSSFAEFRYGRWHAGIDLRTNGTGREVHAIDDGYVSRIRCSPYGYGKAVYLTLNDGHTVVFAHLNAFAPVLREFVRDAQHAAENYTVDLFPEAGRFTFKRGEVLAWSGDTGIGVPHLHYEIRDSAARPVNPRSLGITWPDDTRPSIRKVLVCPRDPASLVAGDIVPVTLDVVSVGAGAYRTDPVTVSGAVGFGAVGFGVDVIDPANEGSSKLGVYRARLLVDGAEVFRMQNDRLSYETISNGAVAWHPFLMDEGRFLLLWRWPGNRASSYNLSEDVGFVTAPEDHCEAVLELEDFAGNRAMVTIPIRREEPAIPEVPAQADNGQSGSVQYSCVGDWLVVTALFPGPEAVAPVLRIEGPAPEKGGVFQRVGRGLFRAGYQPAHGAKEAVLWVEHPRLSTSTQRLSVFKRGENLTLVEQDGVEIEVAPDSPYGTLFAQVQEFGEGTVGQGLRVAGKRYRLWPAESPVDAPVRLAFPASGERAHIYRRIGSRWVFQETERRSEGRLAISTRNFGDFAAMVDDTAPVVAVAMPEEGAVVSKRPTIKASVSDEGSGVAGITVTANGQWLLTEYDPERGEFVWLEDQDLPPGDVEIQFVVSDAAGNVSTHTRKVTVGS